MCTSTDALFQAESKSASDNLPNLPDAMPDILPDALPDRLLPDELPYGIRYDLLAELSDNQPEERPHDLSRELSVDLTRELPKDISDDQLVVQELNNVSILRTHFEHQLKLSEPLARKLSQFKKFLFAHAFDIPLDANGKLRRRDCLTSLNEPFFVHFFKDKRREHQLESKQVKEGEEPFEVVPLFGYNTPHAVHTAIINWLTFHPLKNPRKKEYIFITEQEFFIDLAGKDAFVKCRVSDIHHLACKNNFPLSIDEPSIPDDPVVESYYMLGDSKTRAENSIQVTILETFPLTLQDKLKLVAYHHGDIPRNLNGELNFIKFWELTPFLEEVNTLMETLPAAFNLLSQRHHDLEDQILRNHLKVTDGLDCFQEHFWPFGHVGNVEPFGNVGHTGNAGHAGKAGNAGTIGFLDPLLKPIEPKEPTLESLVPDHTIPFCVLQAFSEQMSLQTSEQMSHLMFECLFSVYRASNANPTKSLNSIEISPFSPKTLMFSGYPKNGSNQYKNGLTHHKNGLNQHQNGNEKHGVKGVRKHKNGIPKSTIYLA